MVKNLFLPTCLRSVRLQGAEPFRHVSNKVRKGKTTDIFRYRWFEAVPLRDGKDAMLVNRTGFEIVRCKGPRQIFHGMGRKPSRTKENVAEIVACGRRAGRSRTQGFNVMKNHGYEFEQIPAMATDSWPFHPQASVSGVLGGAGAAAKRTAGSRRA